MELETSLFNFLVNCYVIKESPTFKTNQANKSIVLDLTATKFMESGLSVAKFLTYITLYIEKQIGQKTGIDINKMQTLKVSSSNKAAKFNWNIIFHQIEILNVNLSDEEKTSIIRGDHNEIVNLLVRMKDLFNSDLSTLILQHKSQVSESVNLDIPNEEVENTPSQLSNAPSESKIIVETKKKLPKASIDIDKMDVDKDPNECTSCVEFILLTISKTLNLTSKQAAAFLAKENKLLFEACSKGLKTGYGELVSWHKLMAEHSIHLSNLIISESAESPNVFRLIMNSLKCGISSNNSELVDSNLKLLSSIALDFSSLNYLESVWEWFIDRDNGLLILILDLINKHPHLFSSIVDVITNFSKGHVMELFTNNFKEYYTDEVQYWEALTSFLTLQLSSDIFKDDVKEFLCDKIDEILKKFDYYQDENLKSATTTFINELWILYEDIMTDSNIQKYYRILKTINKTTLKAIQFVKIAEMFKLLEIFTLKKNSAAPVIYKSLIFVLVDNHQDSTTRQYMISNFIKFFSLSDTIPVGILIEPLMKQFSESEGVPYDYNIFDFDLLTSLVNHPKLKLTDAIPIMDTLAKIYLNDITFCYSASVPLLIIISKFIDNQVLQEYIKKFITLSLSMYQSITQESLLLPPVPIAATRSRKPAKPSLPTHEAMDTKLKRVSVVSLCHKLISLQNSEVNSLIESLTLSIIHQLGLLSILDLLGDSAELIAAFEREEARILQEEANRAKMLEKVEELDDEQQEETKTVSIREPSREAELASDLQMAVVPYLKQKPTKEVEKKAFDHLEKIRKRKEEQKKQRDKEEISRKVKEEKTKRVLKKQIEIRRVELGIKKRKGDEIDGSMLLKEGEFDQTTGFGDFLTQGGTTGMDASKISKYSKLTGVGKKFLENYKGPEVILFDYEAEEQRDVDAIKNIVKRYSKLFKFLFTKYANSGYSVKGFRNFEELNKKLQTITVAEIMKMLRDHYVTNRIISKTKVTEIVRQIQSNTLPLEYTNFVEFVIQLGYVIYTTPPNNMTHLTPAETLSKLIIFFEESAKNRGQSTIIYEDSETSSNTDK